MQGKIVKSVSVGPDGTAWILNSEQLSRLQVQASSRIERVSSEVSWAWCNLADRDGTVWVATLRDGLFRLRHGNWWVWSLYGDAEDTVWIGGYDRGLSRLRGGNILGFSAPSLRLPGMIGGILEDNQGSLWLCSNRGIHRALRKELNDFADGRADSVTPSAMPSATDSPRRNARAARNRWLAKEAMAGSGLP